MPPHSKKKQVIRLNSVKIIIINSNVMHYMPFGLHIKLPTILQILEKKGGKKRGGGGENKQKLFDGWRPLVNETTIIGTDSETPKN